MPTGFVNIHGQPIEQFFVHPVALKPRRESPAEYHKGWIVEGHPPGSMEEAKEEAEKAVRDCGPAGAQRKDLASRRQSHGARNFGTRTGSSGAFVKKRSRSQRPPAN